MGLRDCLIRVDLGHAPHMPRRTRLHRPSNAQDASQRPDFQQPTRSPEPRSPEPLPTDRHGLTQSPQRGMGRYIVFFLDSHTTTIPTIHLIWTEV